MSPARARVGTLYFLVVMNVLLCIGFVGGIAFATSLRSDVRQTAESLYVGCQRSNVQRDAVRFLLQGRVRDSSIIEAQTTNDDLREYFRQQKLIGVDKLAASLKAAQSTFANPDDPYLVDCDKAYPRP